ncbi:GntR family transcriptional regulator [soil metagenome]
MFARPTVETETVGDALYRHLKNDIIFARLAPGQKLRLDSVGQTYGVSASTLREILNRLCSDGFVAAEGQRGFEVAAVSSTGFREVAAMRLLLECAALEASFAAGDLEWEGRVVAAHHKLARLEGEVAGGDGSAAERWKNYDREFHQSLVSACGSEVMLETHASVYDRYLRYQMVFEIYRGGIAALEHRTLLDCALKRDIGQAKHVLVQHVEGCVEAAVSRGNLPAGGRPKSSKRPLANRSRSVTSDRDVSDASKGLRPGRKRSATSQRRPAT